ncbi:hypothetical protein D9758_015618 [Tetrapyrgos nigripes]|uniref:Uncharacterized protein n=1 Tax=Tetrapyrgos nigripes TaxID=182062 RepID=A0A8H5CKY2_9AGAR|nr:hypothetical protein D9758_015618 [Tetrapyrgos nigripes]
MLRLGINALASDNNTVSYQAFYQYLDNAPVFFDVGISPGDTIELTIMQDDISIIHTNTGITMNVINRAGVETSIPLGLASAPALCGYKNAAWMVSQAVQSGTSPQLDIFGSISFSEAFVTTTSGSPSAGLRLWRTDKGLAGATSSAVWIEKSV